MPPQAPHATLSAPPSVRVGVPFEVDASGSTDGHGGGGLRKYLFVFGDGTRESSPEPAATHTYRTADSFPVTVTVTNKRGLKATSAPVMVEVVADAPPMPVDCELSEWSEWSEWQDNGDSTETRTRTRTILVEPANGGMDCDHQEESETQAIVTPPVDCELSEETITAETPLEACQPDGFQAVEVAWVKHVIVAPAGNGAPCGPLSGTRLEKRACEYVSAEPPEPHPYYAALTARPDCFLRFPLRSAAELATYPNDQAGGQYPVTYDPGMDACLTHVNYPVTGKVNPHTIVLPLVIPFGVSWFMTWDERLNAGWRYTLVEGVQGDRGRKTYRWECAAGAAHSIWLAQKHFFQEGTNDHTPPALSQVVTSCQAKTWVIPPTVRRVDELLIPQTLFYAEADRWMRHGYFYDTMTQELSSWSADLVQGFVARMDRTPYGFPSTGLKRFRIDYDTSQDAFPNTDERAWNRNVVVLRDLDYATAVSLLRTEGLS